MAQRDYVGWASQTSFGKESTYGTKPANTNSPFGKVITCGIKPVGPPIEHRSKSSGRNVGKVIPGRVRVEGPVEFSPQNGLFLEHVFGELRKGAKGNGTATPLAADDDNEVVSGCNVEEQTTPNMTLKLAAGGSYDLGGTNYSTTAIATITIGAADPSNPRIDIISIKDSAGTTVHTVTAGTAAVDPVPDWASVPTDELVIALVWVGAGVTQINTADVRQLFWVKEKNTIPSLTVEDDYLNPDGSGTDDLIQYFLGCKVNEFSYSISRGQTDPIKFVANCIGKKPQTNPSGASASTITDYAGNLFTEWNTELEIAGGTSYDLNDFSFSVNNNLKGKGTDGRYFRRLVENNRVYSASAKIDLLDKKEIERYYGAADATEPQDTIGTFTIKHTLKKPKYEFVQFVFSNASYKDVPTDDPLDDTIQQTLNIGLMSCQVQIVEGTETY